MVIVSSLVRTLRKFIGATILLGASSNMVSGESLEMQRQTSAQMNAVTSTHITTPIDSATNPVVDSTRNSVILAEPPANTVEGIASFYGTVKDRFGFVDRDDPLVQELLKRNGVDSQYLPVRFVAAGVLKPEQIEALVRVNSNKYRLLTATGKPYNPTQLSAAMNKIYLGKQVKVTNTSNGKFVVVRVTDTGKFEEKYGRVADLSAAAAEQLGYTSSGLAQVKIEILN